MRTPTRTRLKYLLIAQLSISFLFQAEGQSAVPLYRMFETPVVNSRNYDNPFTEVQLDVQFQAPSGRIIDFFGFFDGDGKGKRKGNVWKVRFMPDETGTWKYVYSWSDGNEGGTGSFDCTMDQAGKGVLQPYIQNPHWFAYNGTEPVWLKSYYESGHGSIGQDFDWIVKNVYTPLFENGYNHLQVNWLLSLCCFSQYYQDGPAPEKRDLSLYREGDLWGSMDLDVWKRMEQHLGWLNAHDMGVHMFLGVDGSRNDGPDWKKLRAEEKEAFARYMVARLAPYANLAGWNFVWEVPGDREAQELGFARLIAKYDVFDHLRTYEDEYPRENEYNRDAYNFAAIENHHIASEERELDRVVWKEPWTHHMACLLGYRGKPVFMSEGNALWRRYWHPKAGADQDDLRRAAWACATAGASFTWNGHSSEEDLRAGGETGLPFSEVNPYKASEQVISVLTDIIQKEVIFHQMNPHDLLLTGHSAIGVYLLAEPGHQYLVFSTQGEPFGIKMEPGTYTKVTWVNAKTGGKERTKEVKVKSEKEVVSFRPPDQTNDWVLIIKN